MNRQMVLQRAAQRMDALARRAAGQNGNNAMANANAHCPSPYDPGNVPAPGGNVRDCPPAHMPWICAPCKVYGMGVDSGVDIAIGATLQLPGIGAQKPFLAQLLIVPSELAPFFTLDRIEVGTNNMMVASAPQPASAYSEVSVNNILNLDAMGPGINFILTVTNIGGPVPLARRFRAAIFGTAIPVA